MNDSLYRMTLLPPLIFLSKCQPIPRPDTVNPNHEIAEVGKSSPIDGDREDGTGVTCGGSE